LCSQRDIPADALAVHGLTAEFLADKPLFADVADEFLRIPQAVLPLWQSFFARRSRQRHSSQQNRVPPWRIARQFQTVHPDNPGIIEF